LETNYNTCISRSVTTNELLIIAIIVLYFGVMVWIKMRNKIMSLMGFTRRIF
jgi:hypothetical protein